jgi:hypothetical protein
MYAQNVFWPVLLVMLATPAHGWIVLLTQQARGLPVDWLASTLRVVLPELVLNILLTIPIYPAFRWLVGRLGVPVME